MTDPYASYYTGNYAANGAGYGAPGAVYPGAPGGYPGAPGGYPGAPAAPAAPAAGYDYSQYTAYSAANYNFNSATPASRPPSRPRLHIALPTAQG